MKPLAVGVVYRRREPKDDAWDEIVIRGYAEGGEQVEPVVSPRSFGEPVAVNPDNLLKHYTQALPDPAADVEQVAAKLEAWQTHPQELTNNG